MNLNTSKTVLKVFGYISIVFGILGVLGGILAIAGGSLVGLGAASGEVQASQDMSVAVALLGFGGLVLLISAVIELISGICSVRAAKDISKIMPAWIFSLIGLVLSIGQIIYAVVSKQAFANNANPVSVIIGYVLSIAISALIFVAANNVKQAAGK